VIVRKSQNSVIFLTTLGVYIGLLMVGATPGIVAQQAGAMTRNFDVTDEIEVRDDLDENPDAFSAPELLDDAGKWSEFARAYANFVLADYDSRLEFEKEMEGKCPEGCRLSYLWYFPTFVPEVEALFGVSKYSEQASWTGNQIFRELDIEHTPSASELSNLQRAFADADGDAPASRSWQSISAAARLILRNSSLSISPKSRHLVIVTRLPRAALDELLASDAK
jgi:hypothetical protein